MTLLTLVATLVFGVSVWVASAEAAPLRVMPLGDSITHGYNVPGGYRSALEDSLVAGGHSADFVGSLSNGPAELDDRQHEGHEGWRIDQIAASVDAWLAEHRPQVILLLIGTNDVLQNRDDIGSAPQRLSALIDRIDAGAPSSSILVASIPPLSSPAREERAWAYNAAIPGIIDAKVAQGKAVSYVDMHSALSASTDLADGVHPNRVGYDRMASVWYAALQGRLSVEPGLERRPEPAQVIPVSPATEPVPGPAPTAEDRAGRPAPAAMRPRRLVGIAGTRLRADRRGRVRVRVNCRDDASAVCSGILRLRTVSSERTKGVHLASHRFRVRRGRTESVRLRLDRGEVRRLRGRSSTRISIQTVIRSDARRYATRTSARLVVR